MKVCFLTTSFPAYQKHFQSPFIYQLARRLVKQEIELDVICPYYSQSREKLEVWNGIHVRRFQYFVPRSLQKLSSQGGLPSSFMKFWIAKLQLPFYLVSMFLRAQKSTKTAQIIHANWVLSGLVGVILKKIYKKPLILTTRGVGINMALSSAIFKKILLWILNNSDYITPNNYEHKKMLSRLGVKNHKIVVIPNGVDTTLFRPQDRAHPRKQLSLPKDKVIILSVGWLIPRKGYTYLLDAMSRLVKYENNLLLIIVGSGIEHDKLIKQADVMGISEYVMFVDSQAPDKIPRWMNAADIFVLPSLSEGRPNVVPEAMSCELPVIATRVGGTPEFIDNNKTGILVNPKNPKDLEKAIKSLIVDPAKRKTMGSKARKEITSRELTWEACASQYNAIYRKMIK